MLGKLMKHEWRTVWKVPVLLIGILLVLSLLTGFSFALPMWESDWGGLQMSAIGLIMLYYMAVIVCSVGIMVYLAVRFYKSMFTDEGYLTHTLPATSHQLLLSKVITMSVWNLIGAVGVIISICLLAGSVFLFWMNNVSDLADEFRGMIHALAEVNQAGEFTVLMITMLFLFVASSFSGTMTVVGSVCIGQMLRKHRILGAIGAYFGITTLVQIFSTIIMMPVMFRIAMTARSEDVFSIYIALYWGIALVGIAAGVGLYFLSEYLIRRQLDLE